MVNVKPLKLGKTTRMSFSKIDEVIKLPNLLEIQKNSYKWFLDEGLKEVFRDVSVWSPSDCWKSETYSRHTMKLKKVAESWWLKPIRTKQRKLSQINKSWEVDTAEDRSYNYSTVISWMMGLPYWKNDRLTSAETLTPQR